MSSEQRMLEATGRQFDRVMGVRRLYVPSDEQGVA